MKSLLIAVAGTALAAGTITTSAIGAETVEAAGPFDKLKKKVKKAKKKAKEAEEVVNTVDAVATGRVGSVGSASGVGPSANGSRCNANRGSNSNSPCTARAPGHAGVAGPTPAKYANATKCANIGVGNAFVARDGNYTFQQGISTEERSGLLDRRPITPTNGCVFEGLGIGDVLYVEFDANKFKKYSYRIQCVSYDGSEQQDNTFGPKIGNYKGKAVMLHTGNSTGYEPTASGSNSSRSAAYDKYMAKRGRAFTTFNFEALHTDKSGTDFYCQWYNRDTGESAIALTYRRGPVGS
ncbi:hypothetical protein [Erythrobacter sp. YT30]|uniref:hypothetical protein n=1 Tax=Erythrobacter sp. YT30 TaxID=1735012 RepID=UPI00076C094D|nr:hypothetical protein [Erythrobacter sp. YT30]KWV90430.1 hypothetical protein AUC45_14355 [Erythrobacter sp. YT30]